MSNLDRIWLSSPHMTNEEESYIKKSFQENLVTTFGSNITTFESNLEDYLNSNKKVVALNSGTSAIHLALIQAGVKEGDEVICQSFTFVATVNPVLYLKAKPIFIDSEEETWNICPELLREAIIDRIKNGKKPKAIIVVHLYGMPARINEIINIANEYDIVLIEDAAEALGSSFRNKKCGNFGNFGIISFNGNKIITTSSGGALICNSHKEKEDVIFLSTQSKENKPYYEHKKIGYNYRMSNVLAGIGVAQLASINDKVEARRKVNEFYTNLLANISGIAFLEEPNKDFYSNHWLTCILINSEQTGFSNQDLKNTLEKYNIESRFLWKPMHLQPIFKNNVCYRNGVSENLFQRGLCLPSGSNLNDKQLDKIETVLTSLF